jgi:hypothetical protein
MSPVPDLLPSKRPWARFERARQVSVATLIWCAVSCGHDDGRVTPNGPSVGSSVSADFARFTMLDGTVNVRTGQSGSWVQANRSFPIPPGAQVQTGAHSFADIERVDGTVSHIAPESLVEIVSTEESTSPAGAGGSYRVVSGAIDLRTKKGTEVWTGSTKTRIPSDGAGAIRVAASGSSEIRVYKGKGEVVTKAGNIVLLNQGEALQVDAAGAPGPKITLPGVPTIIAPPDQSEISFPDTTHATLQLVWKEVPAAVAYHFMLDVAPTFNRPVADRVTKKERSIELRGLEAGAYYWRVAAIDSQGIEGSFSEFSRFTVVPNHTKR